VFRLATGAPPPPPRFGPAGFLPQVARGALLIAPLKRNNGCEQLEGGPTPKGVRPEVNERRRWPAENDAVEAFSPPLEGFPKTCGRSRGNRSPDKRITASGPCLDQLSVARAPFSTVCEEDPQPQARRCGAAPDCRRHPRPMRRSPWKAAARLFYPRRWTQARLGVLKLRRNVPPTFLSATPLSWFKACSPWSSGLAQLPKGLKTASEPWSQRPDARRVRVPADLSPYCRGGQPPLRAGGLPPWPGTSGGCGSREFVPPAQAAHMPLRHRHSLAPRARAADWLRPG